MERFRGAGKDQQANFVKGIALNLIGSIRHRSTFWKRKQVSYALLSNFSGITAIFVRESVWIRLKEQLKEEGKKGR